MWGARHGKQNHLRIWQSRHLLCSTLVFIKSKLDHLRRNYGQKNDFHIFTSWLVIFDLSTSKTQCGYQGIVVEHFDFYFRRSKSHRLWRSCGEKTISASLRYLCPWPWPFKVKIFTVATQYLPVGSTQDGYQLHISIRSTDSPTTNKWGCKGHTCSDTVMDYELSWDSWH